jgi:trigger factor
MDRLNELHTVQLPKAVVKEEIEALKRQMLQQFQMYGRQGGNDIDLPDDLFQEQAERRVRVGLVVNEIVSAAGLTAEPEQVRQHVEKLAAGYAEPQQVINYYMSNAEQRQQIEMAVLEESVVEHILGKADVTEVPSTYNDVISGRAIAPEPEEAAAEDTAAPAAGESTPE